ncbi:MAG: CvpA family protein [Planctomycetota bacterium]
MSVIDAVVLGVVAVGLVLGLLRGFLVQFTGLAGILGGVLLADRYQESLRVAVVDKLVTTGHNAAIAFVAILVVCVVLVALVAKLVRKAIDRLELGAWDRLMGGVFGALKAGLIVAGILLAIVTFAANGGGIERSIAASRSAPWLWGAMQNAASILPERMGGEVKGFLEKNSLPPAEPPAPPPSESAAPAAE